MHDAVTGHESSGRDRREHDIIELLASDHAEIATGLSRFDSEPSPRWPELFRTLTHDLIRHEVAEEEVVYPALRKDAPGGEHLAAACVEEQSEAEQLLEQLERGGVGSPHFATQLARLRAAVLAHAAHEEREVFPALRAVEPGDRRAELGDRYLRAKTLAPTHPHPHAPDRPPGNLLAGPVAALADRMRDAMRGR